MLIVLILLLTVISFALRLASMSINSTRQISNRVDDINKKKSSNKEKTEEEKKKEKVGNAAKLVTNYAAIKASSVLGLLATVISILRNLLLSISPIVLFVEFLISFIIAAIVSQMS